MAQDYVKNIANYSTIGINKIATKYNGAVGVSCHAWINPDTYDVGVNDNRILTLAENISAALLLCVDGSGGNQRVRVGGRSSDADGFQGRSGTTNITTAAWHAVGGSLDFPGDVVTPYLDGVAENGGAVAFAATSYTHTVATNADRIGADNGSPPPAVATTQFDGRIAEVATWDVVLTAAEFAILGLGYCPLLVRPQSLIFYDPHVGHISPLTDIVGGELSTITGTVVSAAHPRVLYGFTRSLWRMGAAPAAPPVVDSPILKGATTVTGTGIAASTVTVYINGSSVGTTVTAGGGTWSKAVSALAFNDTVKATQNDGGPESGDSNTVKVDTTLEVYQAHTIAGTVDGALTNFQVQITVHYGAGTDTDDDVYLDGRCQTDFDDVRFTDASGVAIDYWRESKVDGNNAVYWVEVPSIPASPDTVDIRIYYNVSTAVYGGNIRNTFLSGEDFETFPSATVFASTPLFSTGSCKSGTDIFIMPWDNTTNAIDLWKSTDGGVTWALVSAIYAAGSDRTHSNIDSNGGATLYVMSKNVLNTAIHLKRSTDSGASWSAEINIATGLTGVLDPVSLYVSASVLLCFIRVTSGANFELRCYRSTDNGDTWALLSTPHTEAQAGLNSLEDLDAIVAGNGNILFSWEREVTEKGEASCRQRISTDNGATWGAETTIVDNVGHDDEGGDYWKKADGTLLYIYGTTLGSGGASYDTIQTYQLTSTDHGVTWTGNTVIWESYHGVEPIGEFDASENVVFLHTKQYDVAGTASTFTLVSVVLTGDDFSDRGLQQDAGLAYVTTVGTDKAARVEATVYNSTRGYLALNDHSGQDYISEAIMRSPGTGTNVDLRLSSRHAGAGDQYLWVITGAGVNTCAVYKRVGGAAPSLLDTVAFTPAINTDYRLKWQISGLNPTTIKTWIDGALKNNFTENPSTQTTGKVAISAGATAGRHMNLTKFIFARKFTATEPTHGAWGTETEVIGGGGIDVPLYPTLATLPTLVPVSP